MLLPYDQREPTIFWMQFTSTTENGVTSEKADLTCLGSDLWRIESLNITKMLKSANPGQERFDLEHTLNLYKLNFWYLEPTKKNKCVAELMEGGDVYDYIGPFVVVSQPGIEAHPVTHQDVIHADLRVVVDFLNTFDTRWKCGPFKVKTSFSSDDPLQKINGAVITCLGDQKLCNKKHYIEVEIKGNNEVFNDDPTSISKYMNLPLITFKLPPAPEWRDHSLSTLQYNPYENFEAVRMNRSMDVASYSFGWSHMRKWDQRPGSILVVRADRKDITARQVEALATYCMEDLMEAGQEYAEGEEEIEGDEERISPQTIVRRENFMRDHLCQAKFDSFFERLKAKKVAAGDSAWLDVVSPYSV
jgi:hypothetical protein